MMLALCCGTHSRYCWKGAADAADAGMGLWHSADDAGFGPWHSKPPVLEGGHSKPLVLERGR